MADAPKLNSATDATAAKYAPLSWLAVVAMAVAVLFVFVLLALGWLAYKAGQPLLEVWLFIFPVLGIFLAFIARREIRNSEGARTGEVFANVGWWVCVVVGACYGAYLVANELAVRAEAERAMTQWAEKLAKADPSNPADPGAREAFERTLDPGNPAAGNPQAVFSPTMGLVYGQFRNSPLLLVWARNRADAKFTPNGLRSWQFTPEGKLNAEVAAILSCPEGEFPVYIPLVGSTDPNNKSKPRVWQVTPGQRFQYLDLNQAARTRYGWLVAGLEVSAMSTADLFLDALHMPAPFGPSVAVDGFISGHRDPDYTAGLIRGLDTRAILVGPSALLVGPTDPAEVPAADRPAAFFARGDGQPMTDAPFARADGQKVDRGLESLRDVWERSALAALFPTFKSKLRSTDVAPKYPLVDTSDPARVVVKVPVDFVPRRDEFQRARGTFTTGLLVMECTDPAVLKEVADAYQEAKAGRSPAKTTPPDGPPRQFRFRVIRLESDMYPIAMPDMKQGGAPGGGMPGQ